MARVMGESQQYISKLIKNELFPRKNKIEKFSEITKTKAGFWVTSSGPEKEIVIKKAVVRAAKIKG